MDYSFLPLLPHGEFHCSSHAMLFNAQPGITCDMGTSQYRSAELTLRTLPADQRMIDVEGVSRFLIQTP